MSSINHLLRDNPDQLKAMENNMRIMLSNLLKRKRQAYAKIKWYHFKWIESYLLGNLIEELEEILESDDVLSVPEEIYRELILPADPKAIKL
jgi:hypothetical protein